jgi:hypothetical protein
MVSVRIFFCGYIVCKVSTDHVLPVSGQGYLNLKSFLSVLYLLCFRKSDSKESWNPLLKSVNTGNLTGRHRFSPRTHESVFHGCVSLSQTTTSWGDVVMSLRSTEVQNYGDGDGQHCKVSVVGWVRVYSIWGNECVHKRGMNDRKRKINGLQFLTFIWEKFSLVLTLKLTLQGVWISSVNLIRINWSNEHNSV